MKYHHLTEEERYHIYENLKENYSQQAIAKQLGRSVSTLSRELKRNKGEKGYRGRQAHLKACERLQIRGASNVKRVDESAWAYAREQLEKEQWSPEQIANRLKVEKREGLSHETIYQRVLLDKKAGGDLYTHLRCKKKRKKRYGSARSLRGVIPNRVDIEQRPRVVETRKRTGDWEGDTIIGSQEKGVVINSMVERKSRFTCLSKARDKTTEAVIEGITAGMLPLKKLVLTITLDNGGEFTQHEKMSAKLEADVFFAKPYHSFERGLNENTNGLVRQYFPKKTPFDSMTDEDLQAVARKLNNRPRKCLGYKTPFEVFSQECKKQGVALRI